MSLRSWLSPRLALASPRLAPVSPGRSLAGVSLLEFLTSILLLILLMTFYLEWNSFRAAELRRERLTAQVDEVLQAVQRYRAQKLPHVPATVAGLNSAWPTTFQELLISTLAPDFQTALPGSVWRLEQVSNWGTDATSSLDSYEGGLRLRLELPAGHGDTELLRAVGGGQAWQRHPWKRYLADQNALEIVLPPSPHHYLTEAAVVTHEGNITVNQFELLLESYAGGEDSNTIALNNARFTGLKEVNVNHLRTSALEAGQVVRCCVLTESATNELGRFDITASWPTADVGQTRVAQSKRRIAHTGMGYLGLGDAFVGSDALYTRILTLGGDDRIHVDEIAPHRHSRHRSESSYFSYMQLHNVQIVLGPSRGCQGIVHGKLIGWRPSDLQGAQSYEAYRDSVEHHLGLEYRDRVPADYAALGRQHVMDDGGDKYFRPYRTPYANLSIYQRLPDPAVRNKYDHCPPQGPTASILAQRDSTLYFCNFPETHIRACSINIQAEFGSPKKPWGGWYYRAPDRQSADHRGFGGGLQRRSDARFKKDIRPLQAKAAALDSIRAYSYDKGGQRQTGFVAQEVRKHYPELIRQNEDGYLKLRYEGMVPVLWGQLGNVDERNADKEASLRQTLDELAELMADAAVDSP